MSVVNIVGPGSRFYGPAAGATGFTFDSGYDGTGTFTDGQDVTITGTGFGTKPNGAKPLYFWDFDASINTHALSRTSATSSIFETNVVRDTTVAPTNATNSLRKILDIGGPEATPPGSGGAFFAAGLTITAPDLYTFKTAYFSFDGTEAGAARAAFVLANPGATANFNLKGDRLWYNLGQGDQADAVLTYHDSDAGFDPGQSLENVINETQSAFNPRDTDQDIPKATWFVQENIYHQSSSTSAGDGNWWVSKNGKTRSGQSGLALTDINTRDAGSPGYQTLFFGWQDERTGWVLTDNQYVATGVLYIDDSLKRFVVSDKSTWSTASVHSALEIQIPTDWSDTSVSLRLRRGMTSLSGKYLYYVDGITGTRIGQFT